TKNRKNIKKYKIDYVCEDFINFDSPHKFEVIVTPFFLDLFPLGEINSIFQKISALLVVNGKWLVADFTMPTNNFFQKALIKIMYAFFKMTTHIKANDILDYKRMIMEQNYDLEKYKEFYSSMIFSAAFKKR
ncbi:MAG: hypothetical protein OEY34_08380, partial [Cyclobacteriaceae bacterium]|nr:hypothetical protein [Cyclobacteriaceae bacterium]